MNNDAVIVPITDDYMFCHVFEDKEKCKELLQRVLGIRITDISILTYQKVVENGKGVHGIRLDVYVVDDNNNVYDIEMQTYAMKSLGKRVRFYHSEIDGELLRKGQTYDKLRKNVVIVFYCAGDPFGKGRSVYTFNTRCIEEPELNLNDDVLSIILWPGGSYDGIDGKLMNVLEYINTGKAKDDFTESIAAKTIELSMDDEWRSGYMTYQNRLYEENVRGYERGKSEGKLEGIQETIIRLVNENKLTIDEGAKELNVSNERMSEMINQ